LARNNRRRLEASIPLNLWVASVVPPNRLVSVSMFLFGRAPPQKPGLKLLQSG
jgi:hypothetical protein